MSFPESCLGLAARSAASGLLLAVPLAASLLACVSSPTEASALRELGAAMPRFAAGRWVNSPPLQPEGLRGKVALVNFWEYTCINWIRTLPFVSAWHARYAPVGLVVIGVHTPEFEFGKRPENVDRGIRDHRLTYPVAIDNDYGTWTAFHNDAWPTKYLFDAQGHLRGVYAGEGDYPAIENKRTGSSSRRRRRACALTRSRSVHEVATAGQAP